MLAVKFAMDSPLEGTGFELSVPREIGFVSRLCRSLADLSCGELRAPMRRAVPRRIDHRIQFDRIHTFDHRSSQTSPALLRRNAAWIAVGRRLGLPIEHGFSIDGCEVCEARISPRCF